MKVRPLYLVLCAALFAVGCSAEPEPEPVVDAGPPVCDPARCAEGNICVQNKCMLECLRATDCPNGYDCKDVEGSNVCVANNKKFGAGGYYGFGCGVGGDTHCAQSEGFLCHGRKDSADAYCTTTCTTDDDCPGTYWCKDVDLDFNQTRKTCIKREYCAPAKTLGDCADPDAVLATDSAGNSFCTYACDPTAENPCGFGNDCVSVNGGQCWPKHFDGKRQCFPETKKFCGRCISQEDCPDGSLCYQNEWTREKFCMQPCGAGASCPAETPGGKAVSCGAFREGSGFEAYGNQCIPEPSDSLGLGCWFPRFN